MARRGALALRIRWPLLARGTKAMDVGFIVFLSISSHCFSSYQAVLLCLGPNTPGSAPPNPGLEIRFFIKNRFVFKPAFKLKNPEKPVPRPPNKIENDPEFH